MAWVAKVKRRDGGVSVLAIRSTHFAAREQAGAYNRRYQTDAAYVEAFDSAQEAWPSARDDAAGWP